MLSFEAARAKVIEIVSARSKPAQTENINLIARPETALGRILAEDIFADRDYPPFHRSIRDGYALRATDASHAGAKLRVIGESRAGFPFDGNVGTGECVRILTGAGVPRGGDAVVMQEYARREGDTIVLEQSVSAGQFIVGAGSETKSGSIVLKKGARMGYAELAMAAQVGYADATVYARPRVAILSTGDEVVDAGVSPGPFQIRNSNGVSLVAQVALAGGEALQLGNVGDDEAKLRARIDEGLKADILIVSGGVSVGDYDFVEDVLRDLGAEFFFDTVAIRPGKPTVFGWCRGKPVFGLPGNPVSTMVTFELFVAPAIEILSGAPAQPMATFKANLKKPVSEKAAITHFLPARVDWTHGEPVVEVISWGSSGDVTAVVAGKCFLVVQPSRLTMNAGEMVDVLLQRGRF